MINDRGWWCSKIYKGKLFIGIFTGKLSRPYFGRANPFCLLPLVIYSKSNHLELWWYNFGWISQTDNYKEIKLVRRLPSSLWLPRRGDSDLNRVFKILRFIIFHYVDIFPKFKRMKGDNGLWQPWGNSLPARGFVWLKIMERCSGFIGFGSLGVEIEKLIFIFLFIYLRVNLKV